jgi:hypothetical protein
MLIYLLEMKLDLTPDIRKLRRIYHYRWEWRRRSGRRDIVTLFRAKSPGEIMLLGGTRARGKTTIVPQRSLLTPDQIAMFALMRKRKSLA